MTFVKKRSEERNKCAKLAPTQLFGGIYETGMIFLEVQSGHKIERTCTYINPNH